MPVFTSPSAIETAPVSVAMSMTRVAPSFFAYATASARIRRPSASVLMISMVLPVIARLRRLARRHVLGRGHDAEHRDRRLELGDCAHDADDGRAARHVVLHQ